MAIVEGKESLTQLLRQGKVIAAKLDLGDFERWVDYELDGYPEGSELPRYRRVVSHRIEMLSTLGEWEFSAPQEIPMDARQPFYELAALSLEAENYFPLPTPSQPGASYPYIVVGGSEFKRIMDAVANRLLDWALKLEKLGVRGEEMNFNEKEKQTAAGIVYNIGTVQGMVGNVTNSQVTLYDYHSVNQLLVDHNVPKQDRRELEDIMDALKEASPEKKPSLIKRGEDWLVRHKDSLGALAEIVRKAIGVGAGHPPTH